MFAEFQEVSEKLDDSDVLPALEPTEDACLKMCSKVSLEVCRSEVNHNVLHKSNRYEMIRMMTCRGVRLEKIGYRLSIYSTTGVQTSARDSQYELISIYHLHFHERVILPVSKVLPSMKDPLAVLNAIHQVIISAGGTDIEPRKTQKDIQLAPQCCPFFIWVCRCLCCLFSPDSDERIAH